MDAKWEPKSGPPPIPGTEKPAPAQPAPQPVLPPQAPEARVDLRPGKAHRKLTAGGTSVSGGPPIPLIAGGVGVVALIVIIIAVSGGDDKKAAVQTADAGVEETQPPVEDDTPKPPPGPSQELRDAVYDFSEALKAEKVISSVKIAPAQPSIVLISSVYCHDETLESVLSKHSKKLRTLGVNLVRCFSRDGDVVFEKQL